MKDSKDKCWYCGSSNMKAVETWFQCQDCGATHVPSVTLGYDPVKLVVEPGEVLGTYRPTDRAVKKAAAARDSRP